MTGFARAEGHADGYGWVWEAKSVNGRGLDLRCRLPAGLEHLERAARAAALARFKRGNLNLSLAIDRPQDQARVEINRAVLEQFLALREELGDRIEAGKPRLEELLAVRGVVELAEETPDEAATEAIAHTLERALDDLGAARRAEGARLAVVLNELLDELQNLAAQAEALAAAQPEALRARLKEQVAALLEAEPALPAERLAQEAALLAAKADVREEVDRLKSHLAAGRALLAEGGAIGRRLEFLCQEFNREANTLGAKSADLELTRVGLALKSVIDQFREQVQNVE